MTCSAEIELGAYVLHALEDQETDAVRRHLTDCETCRDEVRSLAFTASLLALLTREDVAGLEEKQPAQRRRPRRRVVTGLVAGVLAASVVLGVAGGLVEHPEPATPAVVRAVDPTTHVQAAVAIAPHGEETRLDLTLTGAYPGGWCALVARSRDGRADTAATWVAEADGTAVVTGATAIPADELTAFDVVTDTGRLLVRIPVRRDDT